MMIERAENPRVIREMKDVFLVSASKSNKLIGESRACKELDIPSMPAHSLLKSFYPFTYNDLLLIECVWALRSPMEAA